MTIFWELVYNKMAINNEFKDLFESLNASKVVYLVIGSCAVDFYTSGTFIEDLDIWIHPSADNSHKVWYALAKFGAPLSDVPASHFMKIDNVFRFGFAPNCVTVYSDIEGVGFDTAWYGRREIEYDGIPVYLIGKRELLCNKAALNRPRDRRDLDLLR
jgi:hypothetical protein